jgi:hypothetical protein
MADDASRYARSLECNMQTYSSSFIKENGQFIQLLISRCVLGSRMSWSHGIGS